MIRSFKSSFLLKWNYFAELKIFIENIPLWHYDTVEFKMKAALFSKIARDNQKKSGA